MVKMRDYRTPFNNPPMPPIPESMASFLVEVSPSLGAGVQDTVPGVDAEAPQLVVGQLDEAGVGDQNIQDSSEPQGSVEVSSRFLRVAGIVLSAIAVTALGSYVVSEKNETAQEQKSIVRAIEQTSKQKGLGIEIDYLIYNDYLGYNKELTLSNVAPGAGRVVFGDSDRCVDYADISVQVTPNKTGGVGRVDMSYVFTPNPDKNSVIPVELQNLKPIEVHNEQELRKAPYFAHCFSDTQASAQ